MQIIYWKWDYFRETSEYKVRPPVYGLRPPVCKSKSSMHIFNGFNAWEDIKPQTRQTTCYGPKSLFRQAWFVLQREIGLITREIVIVVIMLKHGLVKPRTWFFQNCQTSESGCHFIKVRWSQCRLVDEVGGPIRSGSKPLDESFLF